MKELRNKIAHELGIAINELNKTFEGKLNWFLHRKVEELGKILDIVQDLIDKEKELGK